MQAFGYTHALAVPRVTKAVINCGIGRLMASSPGAEEKVLPQLMSDLAAVSSQKPVVTKARKSIAGFKIRQGQIIGLKVTMRGGRMYDFLERLIHVALPRVRDFKGIALKSFDGQGNLTIGMKEHIVFPEVSIEQVKSVVGLEITVITDAKTREEAIALTRYMGFPIKKT